MHRLWTLFFIGLCVCRAADDPAEILQHVREAVAAQIAKQANYTCVETIDRSYFTELEGQPAGCVHPRKPPTRHAIMHDRLRLDIAVSEGAEIYAWHGANRFSTSDIGDIVQSGPISSGNFVGFLQNIFLYPGVHFQYSGVSNTKGRKEYNFDYVVPLDHSGYHVQAKHGSDVVAYHGSLSVNVADYRLTGLAVIADKIPDDSDICTAETNMKYQVVNISGNPSLIPGIFELQIESQTHLYTISRSEYSQCREFRGESTLHFDLSNAPIQPTAAPPIVDEWLPGGLTLRVQLRTPIDDRTSYTGDPVEGILLDSVHVPETNRVLPKGSILAGVITKLEFRHEPWKHYLIRVQFNRLTYGNNSFLLRATPKTSRSDYERLADVYGRALPPSVMEESRHGLLVRTSSHIHLDSHLIGEWETQKPPEQKPNASASR